MTNKFSKHTSNVVVSIIVPVYNAEKYIKKCISSILAQSYNDIEVIVVNDGSTDGTLKILKDFVETDNRLNVVNNRNKGVSEARNDGIKLAKGDYLVFVDADDYIASDYIEYMINLAETTSAEFCISKNCYTKKDELQIENDDIKILSAEDAVALLLSPRVIVGCWNKIYTTEFVRKNAMKFSSSLFYGEGLFFITNAAQYANCVGVGNRKVYYYRRNNEASATTKFDIEKMRNGERALLAIKDNIKFNSVKIDTMWKLHMCLFSLGAITRMKINQADKKYKEDYLHWKKYLLENLWPMITSNDVSIYRKSILLYGSIFPGLVAMMDVVRRKIISINSVEG